MSANVPTPAQDSGSRLTRLVPCLDWLPRYQPAWLMPDLIAGVTLAAYAIPVSLAYAGLAGLPPEYGVYCYLVAGIGYAIFGTSRQLAIGPTSAIAMLVGATVGSMAGDDLTRWASIAALTALMVAVLGVVAWLLRLSGLVNFISETILVGFKAGAALTIGMTQLPKLFGVPGGGDSFFERAWILGGQLDDTKPVVLSLGVVAIVLLIIGERLLPGRPIALGVVAAAIIAVSFFSLQEYGVTTVGILPAGLPHLRWPDLRPRDVDGVLPLAAACFLLAYVEGISAARAIAERHGDEINPRQELLALGAANFFAALFQGFPVAGGLSQSTVNDKAGAKTPAALIFASLTIGACLLFFTGLLRDLPNVILAAVVLVAVRGLVKMSALRHLWRVSRFEFWIAMVALVGVLLLGILKGVLLAVIVSLLMLVGMVSHPHVAFLGRIPGTKRFSDLERHPENEVIAHTLIFRVESSLLYFNTEHVLSQLLLKVEQTSDLRLVVCDLSNAPYVDVAGAEMLAKLQKLLRQRSISLRIVEARSRVRDLLRAEDLDDDVGYFGRHISLDQAIAESSNTGAAPIEDIDNPKV